MNTRTTFKILMVIIYSVVFYVVVGNLLHYYFFPEKEPDSTMYPVSGDTINNVFAGEQSCTCKPVWLNGLIR